MGKFPMLDITVFHLHREGVTVHKPHSLNLKLHIKPVLQGWRDGSGLWHVSLEQPLEHKNKQSEEKETAANTSHKISSCSSQLSYQGYLGEGD